MSDTVLYPGCDLCMELNGQEDDRFHRLHGEYKSRIVLSIGELRVFPSLGEILPAHLLIVPTYHATASSNFVDSDKRHLIKVIGLIRRSYHREFGENPTFFEHGDPTGNDVFAGQCVSHAHIHALPRNVEMRSKVSKAHRFIGSAPAGSSVELTESYLSVMDDQEQFHYFSAVEAPRQYLRALYSRLVDRPGAENWITNVDIKKTDMSIALCRRIFAQDFN